MSTSTLIIGGHGKIALLLEPQLADRGEQVFAVIRNADQQPDVAATGAQPLLADIAKLEADDIANLASGKDAIVWLAGAGGGSEERTYSVDRDAAIRTIDAAVQAGVRRFVMVSYFGARTDHGVPPENTFFAYAEAKAAADAHLRSSGLEWTILAPSSLTSGPHTGRIDTTAKDAESVSRADVAAVIATTLTDASTIGRTIQFNSGSDPIAEAISA